MELTQICRNADVSPWLVGATCLPVAGAVVDVVEHFKNGKELDRVMDASPSSMGTREVQVLSRAALLQSAKIVRVFLSSAAVVSLIALGVFGGPVPIVLAAVLGLLLLFRGYHAYRIFSQLNALSRFHQGTNDVKELYQAPALPPLSNGIRPGEPGFLYLPEDFESASAPNPVEFSEQKGF